MRAPLRSILGGGLIGLALWSAPASAQVISGFGNGTGFTLNTSGTGPAPTISGGVLNITSNNTYESRSVFYNTPVTAGAFTAEFTYQASGSKAADGITFVIENDPRGANARGGYGSGLGYGNSDEDEGGQKITSSVAFEINIFGGHTRGINVQTNGAYTGLYGATGSVAFNSGHEIKVELEYDGSLLSATMKDLTTSQTFSTSYSIGNLATLLGGSTGYVGFTGATGSQISVQTISNFSFSTVPEPSTFALLGLGLAGLVLSRRQRRPAS